MLTNNRNKFKLLREMIRSFKESDLQDIETIYEKSNNALSLNVEPGFFSRDRKKFTSETIRSCRSIVCEREGKVVGIIAVSHGCIEGLFVLPEYWDNGIGTELLNSIPDIKEELYLQVYSDNERAVGFYKKHGFKIVGNGVCQATRLPYFEMVRASEEQETAL